jgi:hypothetical protein
MDTLREILRNHSLVIPTNQNAYSWRNEDAEALVNDLQPMGDNSHNLGPLIVTPGASDPFRDDTTRDYIKEYIIDDGQQGMTSCLLMVKSLQKRFVEQKNQTLKREANMVRFAVERCAFGCCSDVIRFEIPENYREVLEDEDRFVVTAFTPCIEASDLAENAVVDEILAAQADSDYSGDVAPTHKVDQI